MEHPNYQEAYAAVTKLIGNTDVSPEVTRNALEELGSMIDSHIAALNEEIED